MAAPVGRTDSSVTELLFARPEEFEFFQAVRLLARIYSGRRLISGFREGLDELVRFHAHLSLHFPASAIQSLEPPSEEGAPVNATVNFMGLTGPQGVLPTYYTEFLIGRSLAHDSAPAAFFNLFNHRLISLFYLAWEKHRFPVAYEREIVSSNSPGRFTEYLFDLIGMGTRGLAGRIGISDFALLSFAGLIAQRPHSAVALRGMLGDFFQVPIEIDQFMGKWCALEPQTLSRLDGAGVHNQLGGGAIAGDQVWNQQARFRIRIGPLSWERFNSFLPDGAGFRALVQLTRYFVNQAMDFEVQVVLLASEVPSCRVSDDAGSPRLGLSSWLKTSPFEDDACDLALAVRSSGPM
jgi:type VI secretion system protein ImpH